MIHLQKKNIPCDKKLFQQKKIFSNKFPKILFQHKMCPTEENLHKSRCGKVTPEPPIEQTKGQGTAPHKLTPTHKQAEKRKGYAETESHAWDEGWERFSWGGLSRATKGTHTCHTTNGGGGILRPLGDPRNSARTHQ